MISRLESIVSLCSRCFAGSGRVHSSGLPWRQRLERIRKIAVATGQLARFMVFGSFVTAQRDLDLAIDGFELFQAREHASAVRKALVALFDKTANNLDARRAIIAGKGRQWLHDVIEPLNERLYNEERLCPYWRNYLKAHDSEFFSD